MQTLVASPLLKRFGPPASWLCILRSRIWRACRYSAMAPSLTALAAVAIVTRTATHGRREPSRESVVHRGQPRRQVTREEP